MAKGIKYLQIVYLIPLRQVSDSLPAVLNFVFVYDFVEDNCEYLYINNRRRQELLPSVQEVLNHFILKLTILNGSRLFGHTALIF